MFKKYDCSLPRLQKWDDKKNFQSYPQFYVTSLIFYVLELINNWNMKVIRIFSNLFVD